MRVKSGKIVIVIIFTAFLLMLVYILTWLLGDQPGELRAAAYRGEAGKVGKILERHREWIVLTDKFGMTALHQSMTRMDEATIDMLLAHKADANATNYSGATAVHLAAGSVTVPVEQQKRVLELLLARGGNLNLKDAKGKTPLDMVNTNTRSEIAVWLRERWARE